MTQEEKNNIITRLQERGAQMPCPRCGHQHFSLTDGYFSHQVQQSFGELTIGGGPTIPTVVVICTQCGFLSQHALGSLGLLPPSPNGNP